MSNPHLEILKRIQAVLMQMHRLLMASQKSELEARTGKAVSPTEWMQLMITEQEYAWMKAMLTLISDIDALMDNYTVSEKDLQIIRQDSEKLFLAGEGETSDFYNHYKEIVQKDPDVILFHSQLRSSIRALPTSETIEETSSIRRNWHVKPNRFH
jgi:hypothetical protein